MHSRNITVSAVACDTGEHVCDRLHSPQRCLVIAVSAKCYLATPVVCLQHHDVCELVEQVRL